MKKSINLLIGFIVGVILIFFIPLFPISLPNMIGTSTSIVWFNGLFFLGASLKDFLLIEIIGGLTALLMTFIFIGGFD